MDAEHADGGHQPMNATNQGSMRLIQRTESLTFIMVRTSWGAPPGHPHFPDHYYPKVWMIGTNERRLGSITISRWCTMDPVKYEMLSDNWGMIWRSSGHSPVRAVDPFVFFYHKGTEDTKIHLNSDFHLFP